MDIVERLREHNEPPFDYIAHEAANEIKRLQTQLKFLQDDAMGYVKEINRLKQVLYRIASMSDDPEFGVPPMETVTKIAQDALYDEGPRLDDRGDSLDGN